MDKFYRDEFEIASVPSKDRVTETHKKYFSKIAVSKTNIEDNYIVYNINITEELFHNELLKARVIRELSDILAVFSPTIPSNAEIKYSSPPWVTTR